jgi:S-adenosylmethionine hydrolase
MPIITLTTDFGTSDGYVGAMKGVLATRAPGATVVDIAHDVPRHDIAHAAWTLATAAFDFPAGTIHVAVVDPGVGGHRAEVIVLARGHLFVGPDNGLLTYVATSVDGCWAITAAEFRHRQVSPTFHGRDVFATAAAALACGLSPTAAGPETELKGHLPWTASLAGEGTVVHVDVYGNLISDLVAPAGARTVSIAGRVLPLVTTYEAVAVGEPCGYVGSMGTVEVAIRDGDAAAVLVLQRGARVRVS